MNPCCEIWSTITGKEELQQASTLIYCERWALVAQNQCTEANKAKTTMHVMTKDNHPSALHSQKEISISS